MSSELSRPAAAPAIGACFDEVVLPHLEAASRLARWLMGDYAGALAPYRECFEVAGSDEHRVAIAYWLYFTLLRLGRTMEAQNHLTTFHAVEEGENVHYFNVLLLLKGERTEDDIRQMMPMVQGPPDSPDMSHG